MYLLAVFRAIKTVWMSRRYRPEQHYMRGPGPKWFERHRGWSIRAGRGGRGSDRVVGGRAHGRGGAV